MVASPTSTVVGGATQSIRDDLVAAWEQQDVLARGSCGRLHIHRRSIPPWTSCSRSLAEVDPTAPEIPYYSATLWDPRERPSLTGEYWVENLRGTNLRFAAAAGKRSGRVPVFGEGWLRIRCSPTRSSRTPPVSFMPIATLPRCGAGTAPFGLRGFVADVHNAGAKVASLSSTLMGGGCAIAESWTHPDAQP